jgi:hypothetical protein
MQEKLKFFPSSVYVPRAENEFRLSWNVEKAAACLAFEWWNPTKKLLIRSGFMTEQLA